MLCMYMLAITRRFQVILSVHSCSLASGLSHHRENYIHTKVNSLKKQQITLRIEVKYMHILPPHAII